MQHARAPHSGTGDGAAGGREGRYSVHLRRAVGAELYALGQPLGHLPLHEPCRAQQGALVLHRELPADRAVPVHDDWHDPGAEPAPRYLHLQPRGHGRGVARGRRGRAGGGRAGGDGVEAGARGRLPPAPPDAHAAQRPARHRRAAPGYGGDPADVCPAGFPVAGQPGVAAHGLCAALRVPGVRGWVLLRPTVQDVPGHGLQEQHDADSTAVPRHLLRHLLRHRHLPLAGRLHRSGALWHSVHPAGAVAGREHPAGGGGQLLRVPPGNQPAPSAHQLHTQTDPAPGVVHAPGGVLLPGGGAALRSRVRGAVLHHVRPLAAPDLLHLWVPDAGFPDLVRHLCGGHHRVLLLPALQRGL
mmetsp:Transcript_8615/g.13212  ORF Transcript_8615/g.13212 Transcript_8615/m.13212 type:complete len:357 (-) Transcript_8615:493-1563(-)